MERDILKATAFFARGQRQLEAVFAFIEAEKANFPVKVMCEVLGVSRAGFSWQNRKPSLRAQRDEVLLEKIRCIHKDSRETYGCPRIHIELKEDHGLFCGRKRVARLMGAHGIRGCCRRRRHWTTRKDAGSAPSEDLLNRDFTAHAPNKRWVADITYVRTWQGFLHVAFVLDLFSRKIVGWVMATHLRTKLVLDALGMAVLTRRLEEGLIHHSDHGCQNGFKGSLQHCLVSPMAGVQQEPRQEYSSQGSFGVGC